MQYLTHEHFGHLILVITLPHATDWKRILSAFPEPMARASQLCSQPIYRPSKQDSNQEGTASRIDVFWSDLLLELASASLPFWIVGVIGDLRYKTRQDKTGTATRLSSRVSDR